METAPIQTESLQESEWQVCCDLGNVANLVHHLLVHVGGV